MPKNNPVIISDNSHRAQQAQSLAQHLQGIDVQISCGLDVVGQAAASNAKFKVHIQDPKSNYEAFDFIFVPSHDPHPDLPNIMETTGLLNHVSPEYLAGKAVDFGVPQPYLAVLVGGRHVGGNFSVDDALKLADIINNSGKSALVTTSKRTEAAAVQVLKDAIKQPCFFYDYNNNQGAANPYDAMLASADEIIVTADSVRMVSEAASSGKPVQIFAPQQLHFAYIALKDEVLQANLPLKEVARVAQIILRKCT